MRFLSRGLPVAAAFAFALVACASAPTDEAERLALAGDHEQSYLMLRSLAASAPADHAVRAALARERNVAMSQLANQASAARIQGESDAARMLLLRMEAIDARDPRSAGLRRTLDRDAQLERRIAEATRAFGQARFDDSAQIVREVLSESPGLPAARALQRRLAERQRAPRPVSTMAPAFQKPLTLEFREAPLRSVFETLGRSSGVNFVFDKDVKSDTRINVFLKDVSLDEAMKVILSTQQLDRKVLNDSSILIYPNNPAKQREHQELVTRSFFLTNADVKQAQALIRTMAKTRDIFIDERLNLVVIRDTPEVVRLVEGLIASLDLPEPEVMLEVEVLEIATNRLDELGVKWPQTVEYGVPNFVGNVTNADRGNFRVSIANPGLVATIHGTSGTTNLLANPRLRARNHEKAKVQIGEKLPVFTSTSVVNVGVSTTVTYLDTGLKLEVEPSVQLDDDVIMKVSLEVTNLIRQVNGPQGSIAYQVGTRNATTSLRLRDGETQILAGLINDEDRKAVDGVPGLSQAPLLGRLFGVHSDTRNKSEVVLLITPRVVRNLGLPDAATLTLAAGNDASPGADSLRMRNQSKVNVPMAVGAGAAPAPTAGIAAPRETEMRARLQVTTSGTVAPGEAVSITLQNESQAIVRGTLEFDGEVLESTDGKDGTSVAFEMPPGEHKVVVLRARPTLTQRSSEIAIDVVAVTSNGTSLSVSVEGSTAVSVVPRR